MKRFTIIIACMVLIALVLTESHSVLYAVKKSIAEKKLDLFLSPTYKRDLQVMWYMKMNFDTMLEIVLSFVSAAISIRYSYKLFCIMSLVFIYLVIDLFAFWYNYKSFVPMYWVLLVFIIASVLILIFVKEKKKGIYISFE